MRDHPEAIARGPGWRIFVTDEGGGTVFAVVLSAETNPA